MGLLRDIYSNIQRANARQGLLGEAVTTTGSMAGADIEYDEEGNPILSGQTLTQQAPRRAGTGYLGSERGPADLAKLNMGLLTSGFDAGEARQITSPFAGGQGDDSTTLMKNLSAAGIDFNTAEGQKIMLDIMKKPQTQINMGSSMGNLLTNEQKKAAGLPVQGVYQSDSKGMIKKISSSKYSNDQNQAGAFALRMAQANKEIDQIEASDEFDPANFVQNLSQFGVPDIMANLVRSPEQQRYEQAKNNWGSANLRDESGAVLAESEMAQELQKYFPEFGDTPGAIAQKKRARKDLMRSMISTSGGAFEEMQEKKDRERLKELRKKHGVK